MKQVDEYMVSKVLLGWGSFGDVYKGYLKTSPDDPIAVKVIPIEKLSSEPQVLQLLKREIEIT